MLLITLLRLDRKIATRRRFLTYLVQFEEIVTFLFPLVEAWRLKALNQAVLLTYRLLNRQSSGTGE